ncbi:MAG: hypothetical protein AAGG79_02465 [Pseudomonadota bacterium]
MSIEELIRRHGLEPHPFEGWWRETAHLKGQSREGLQLIGAADEAHWHRIDAQTTYRLEEKGPAVISLSRDGQTAAGHRLVAPGSTLTVEAGVLRALSCLGAAALLRITLKPDCRVTDRDLMPDDWFPKP